MTDNLYLDKGLFLRELISKCLDALNDVQDASLTNPSVLDSEKELYVWICPDKENKRLIIRDTGIGMTKADMFNNLGTITKYPNMVSPSILSPTSQLIICRDSWRL